MKKILLILLCVMGMTEIISAQSANRSGFFIEAGIGGIVGDTPLKSWGMKDNVVYGKCVAGPALDVGFGGRFRTGRHWAYQITAEMQMPFSQPIETMTIRAMPVGFRYVSTELWRNYSLYAHLDLGFALVSNRGKSVTGHSDKDAEYNDGYQEYGEYQGAFSHPGWGVAYSAGIGVNLTTHLYLEGFFKGQMLFGAYGVKTVSDTYIKGHPLNGGFAGVLVGYRF